MGGEVVSSVGWTTADYALILSLFSIVLALASFVWNVWSKFIFPKPKLETYAGYFVSGNPTASETDHYIMLTVVNHGPMSATVKLLIGRVPAWHSLLTRRFKPFIIKHFGESKLHMPRIDLPKKIEQGEEAKFVFDGKIDWFSKEPHFQIGIVDVFGRKYFVAKKDMKNIQISQRKYK